MSALFGTPAHMLVCIRALAAQIGIDSLSGECRQDVVQYLDPRYTPSKVASSVMAEILAREAIGREKYGVDLDREDLQLIDLLQHAKEEGLDLAMYAEAALQKLRPGTISPLEAIRGKSVCHACGARISVGRKFCLKCEEK